ncbi:hypothetical protein [Nocardia sp. NPDC051833]|uniref:hypothetical protein n=1 Tax=Nocardia sp. NPDC051833 TaxID=3155674 RepID=UPI00343FB2AA
MTTTRARFAAAIVSFVVLAGAASTACSRQQRWCELDQGDVLVANLYCEQGVAGYEWEPDHDKPKHKKKPHKSKARH